MYSKKAKMMIAEQIVGMIGNNVLNECGMESFMGWLEDGDAFFNADCYTDEEIDEAMAFAHQIAGIVDTLSWHLAPENED
jgi:hypothetical protein